MNEIIIGIDLGTTNSEVAVFREGSVEILELEQGSKLLPSVVGLDDNQRLMVGRSAANQYALYPERTVRSIKRRMGSDEKIALGEQQYLPQEISAMILGHLKQAAAAHLNTEIQKAVITVPAYFSDAQRQATRDAGEIAGLEVVRIINEPTAAALAYEADSQGRKTILVYDLGGGTFDVSVVRMEDGVVEVLASHGNNHLGGDDFDNKIVEHVLAHLSEKKDIDASTSRQAMARIQRAAEAAKITLSDNPYANIEEEYLLEHDGTPMHLSLELSRDDYEDMITAYLDETLEAVHTAMDGAKLTVSQLDEVLLVGGATRTPLFQQRLEQELGLQPRSEVDPDLCVVTGAAMQAAIIGGAKVSSVLVDVTPYTFGTSALDELNGQLYLHKFIPLIHKNTPIPVTKSDVFYTSHDGQKSVDVKVYQGEEDDALNNTEIGRFRIEGLSDVPEGNPLITTFALDLNGILQVTSKEKRTGLVKSVTIDNATARFERDEMESAKERVGALIEHEDATQDDAQDHDTSQTRALIEKAEGLIERVGEEDREDIVNQIEALNDALKTQDKAALQAATEQLTDLIFYLES